jgi:hypothetical protein
MDPVTVDHEADGMVYFGYDFGGLSQSDALAMDWLGTLKEVLQAKVNRLGAVFTENS